MAKTLALCYANRVIQPLSFRAWSWTSWAGDLKKFLHEPADHQVVHQNLNRMDTEIWQFALCRFCPD
ncbi:unnamed protein product [Urochloa humidicola]